MQRQVERIARGPLAALSWVLVVVAAALPGACSIDGRRLAAGGGGAGDPGVVQGADAGAVCNGSTCVVIDSERPLGTCLDACPADDACRDFVDAPSASADPSCITLADCPFSWKAAAREGDACRCDGDGCTLRAGEACSAPAACEGGSCVATASGGSVCCARQCAATEVCTTDGSDCAPAEPCSAEGRRCSGALHQSCVDGVWQTLTDCALGCSDALDGCLRGAGQACESDSECGEGTCQATVDGNRVCCTGACSEGCQRCSPEGVECVNIPDDEVCGTLECPADVCRVYDPATVVANRCVDGQCATPETACTVFRPQRAELECSATALCDAEGNCSLPKRELLAACTAGEQCASGACVATAGGDSVCCSQPCADSELCAPTGACVPAPVCQTGTSQCSGSNFQRCVSGQWVTELACGALGCSVAREGCLAGAGQACTADADCGAGTCQQAAAGGSVCCTAACDGACRRCGATGTACTNLQDDAACGVIACPADTTCRDFPASVSALRCVAGSCGDSAALCRGTPRNAGLSCSAANLCDDAGNCSVPKRGNGEACQTGAQCASSNCVDGVCCNSACNGLCETCELTGICRAATRDTACGTVSCSGFDADCVTQTSDLVEACAGRGLCRTTQDCGFRSSTTRCGDGGLCDGQGTCRGPSVECGSQTCSGGDVCCSQLNFETGLRTLGCGNGTDCSGVGSGFGPAISIACDQNADCTGNDVCCLVTNNVNSGEITCRSVCTAVAVGAELGAPPEMLVVGQLCASEVGSLFLQCPAGQTCSSTVSTLPPDYMACR